MFGLIPPRKAERRLARELERPFGLMGPELAELLDRFLGPWSPLTEWPWAEVDTGLEVVEVNIAVSDVKLPEEEEEESETRLQ